MSKQGVPVRVYGLVVNAEDDLLLASTKLPSGMFIAGKDFKANIEHFVKTTCGVDPVEVSVAGILREHGKDSCMAVAFWVKAEGSASSDCQWVGHHAAKESLPEFEGALVDACFRSKPSVFVQ